MEDADPSSTELPAMPDLKSALGRVQQMAEQLASLYPDIPLQARQPEADLVMAYKHAKTLSADFLARINGFAGVVGGQPGYRPGGIKSLDRVFEKVLKTRVIPVDLLGGKIIQEDLKSVYHAGALVKDHFKVVAFKDRFLRPQPGGYRDLQFIVEVSPEHCAELKIVHRLFDALDQHEHKIYEARRSLEVLEPGTDHVSWINSLFLEKMDSVTLELYDEVWSRVLGQKGGTDESL